MNSYEPPEFLGRRIHQIDLDNMYFYKRPPLYNWIRNAKKPLNWYKQSRRFIKHKWQRMTRGYSDGDLWNLNSYLAETILEALNDYRARSVGTPLTDVENPFEAWNEKLDKMIIAFMFADDISKDRLQFVDPEGITDERYEERYDSLVDIYGERNVMTKEEVQYMKEGMHLFVDFFFALWI